MIGVRLLARSFVTYSVRMSYPGTTCCGLSPLWYVLMTRYVAGSITVTVDPPLFGT